MSNELNGSAPYTETTCSCRRTKVRGRFTTGWRAGSVLAFPFVGDNPLHEGSTAIRSFSPFAVVSPIRCPAPFLPWRPELRSLKRGASMASTFAMGLWLLLLAPTLADSSIMTGAPTIEFTTVPDYGSTQNLCGRVDNVEPDSFKVAVYIFVEGAGWWTKPTFEQPLTPIDPDSAWCTDVTTGGSDKFATRMCAFLLPDGVVPPQADGDDCLPDAIFSVAVDSCCLERTEEHGRPSISFAGRDWWIKASVGPVGPGPCRFSDSPENVWVDAEGLHLKITLTGSPRCAEVIGKDSEGYGQYTFQPATPVANFDDPVILGFFAWDNDACAPLHHREVDVEFAGDDLIPGPDNAQYVIQPYGTCLRHRFIMPPDPTSSHRFLWEEGHVTFSSWKGHAPFPPPPEDLVEHLEFSDACVPSPAPGTTPRMNLWLFGGSAPSQEVEVVITGKKVTGVGDDISEPRPPAMVQISPNPFSSTTAIHLLLGNPAEADVYIIDVSGRHVRTLLERPIEAGSYVVLWDGRNASGTEVPEGIYFCLVKLDGGVIANEKMIVVR